MIGVDSSPLAVAEGRGRLAPVAARILTNILYSARNARPDILKAVSYLACFFTCWTSMCDRRLHRLICYIHPTLNYRLIGWVGDVPLALQPHPFLRMQTSPSALPRSAAHLACISHSTGRIHASL